MDQHKPYPRDLWDRNLPRAVEQDRQLKTVRYFCGWGMGIAATILVAGMIATAFASGRASEILHFLTVFLTCIIGVLSGFIYYLAQHNTVMDLTRGHD